MPKGIYPNNKFHKGFTPWNKDKKGVVVAWNKGKKLDRQKFPTMGHFSKHTEESKEKNRLKHLGKSSTRKGVELSEEIKKKISESKLGQVPWNKGKKVPQITGSNNTNWKGGVTKNTLCSDCSKKISFGAKECQNCFHKNHRKENHYNWQGGITPINNQIRGSLEYKLWSDSVWNIDCNCCQKCGEQRIEKLVAHHIQNFAQFPELRFAIDNGITFCRKCHNWFHRIYGKKNNNLKQIQEFLINPKK